MREERIPSYFNSCESFVGMRHQFSPDKENCCCTVAGRRAILQTQAKEIRDRMNLRYRHYPGRFSNCSAQNRSYLRSLVILERFDSPRVSCHSVFDSIGNYMEFTADYILKRGTEDDWFSMKSDKITQKQFSRYLGVELLLQSIFSNQAPFAPSAFYTLMLNGLKRGTFINEVNRRRK